MRTGICFTAISLSLFLLTAMVGCESKSADSGNKEKVKNDHDGHDHGEDEHKHAEEGKHEHYHPGHYKTGYVYHTDGLHLAVAVMLDAENDKGVVAITDVPKDNSSFTEQFVSVKEVTVVPPKDSAVKTEFKLQPDNTNEEGKTSQFALEDAKLAVVMAGHFTVKFELDDKPYSYEIFPHSH